MALKHYRFHVMGVSHANELMYFTDSSSSSAIVLFVSDPLQNLVFHNFLLNIIVRSCL